MIHRCFSPIVTTTILSALIVAPCFAQEGGRRGGGPRGFGGFGGPFGGGDMMLLGLLRVEEVRKEIDLKPDQVEALAKVGEDIRADRPEFNFREASEAEREEMMRKMREYTAEVNKKVNEQLEEVLMPKQLERVRQIALQQQGAAALSDPEIAAKLSLTEDQKQKLNDLQTASREKMFAAMREQGQGGDREAIGALIAESRKTSLNEAREVLNDEQKKLFDEMQGEAFELPASAMRGGFGGGFGRGGGDGGPGGRRGGPGRRGGRGGNNDQN